MSNSPPPDAHPPAGGSKVGMAWGFAILFIVVVMAGVISMFASQLADLLYVIKMFTSVILIFVGVGIVGKAVFGKKPPPPPPAH